MRYFEIERKSLFVWRLLAIVIFGCTYIFSTPCWLSFIAGLLTCVALCMKDRVIVKKEYRTMDVTGYSAKRRNRLGNDIVYVDTTEHIIYANEATLKDFTNLCDNVQVDFDEKKKH